MIYLFVLILAFEARALTPEKLRETVIKDFPLIEEAHLKARAAEADQLAAEGSFDTKLKFSSRNRIEDKYDNQYFETTLERDTGVRGIDLVAGHRQGVGHFPLYDGKYKTSALGEIYAGISVPLLRDSSTDESRTNLALSQLSAKQAEIELTLKKNMYVHKALSLYYKWIAEDRIRRINQELLEFATQREELLEKSFARGDIEKIKLTDNQRAIEKRRSDVQKSDGKLLMLEASLRLFTDDLSEMSALNNEELKQLKIPELSPISRTDELPQIQLLTLERKKNELKEKLLDQGRLPGLAVQVVGARELSGNVPYDPDRLQVGVSFDFPLENRKARGKSVAQSYKSQALERRLSYTERELTLNFMNARKLIEVNQKRFYTSLSESEKTMTMARAERHRLKMGSSDLLVVNLRELDVADAEVRKWNAWYEFHQAVLDARLYQGSI